MKGIFQAFVRGHIPTQLRVSKPSAAYDKKLARLAKLEHKLLDRLKDDGETRAIFEEYVSE